VTKEAAETTGEAKETAVATGQLDCNAGWVGAGAITEGDIQMNLGTCSNFCIIHCKPEFHNNMIAFAYTTDSENTYITVPTTTTGGQLIRYMRDNFYRLVMEQENQCGTDTYDLTNQEAECVRPGSDGLVVLGHLMGELTPIWDVYVRVVVFGLSMNHVRSYDITQ
jgi:sugar (pentulose or hexulose) kinase